jgi:NAD(P)-dependent dehydrogenase (short-subunit alcohol dehydrogenase family)
MPLDDTDLNGQRVVVLGVTSGIGLATAALAAVAGAEVTVVSSRKASVERALAELPPGGNRPRLRSHRRRLRADILRRLG